MTQEEKLLLLMDICGRLPYRVIADVSRVKEWRQLTLTPFILSNYYDEIEKIKPYLRPMSSMTEEEYLKYSETRDWRYVDDDHYEYFDTLETFDYLNSHHFDYRGLIPMGLALEAPEGMYKEN